MKRVLYGFFAIVLLLVSGVGLGRDVQVHLDPGHTTGADVEQSRLDAVFEQAKLATVRIETGGGGVGTGFFIREDGLIMTAHHVVEGSRGLTIVTWDRDRFQAEVVGYDEYDDVAVIRVDAVAPAYLPVDFVGTPSPGQSLVAIGNSGGEFLAPRIGRVVETEQDVSPGLPSRLIISDLPLAPGDSGGPVLNETGLVVGVAVAVGRSPRGFSSLVSPLYGEPGRASFDELVAGERRNVPFLGITWFELTPNLAQEAGVQESVGILITSVLPGTAADVAGLQGNSVVRTRTFRDGQTFVETTAAAGDVITHVDGVRIRGAVDFAREMRSKEVGDRVVLTVDRHGEVLELPARLGVRSM